MSNPTSEQLASWKKNGIIDGFEGTDIDIEGQEGWEEGLVIKNCLNLEEINFSSCDLKKITIQKCPKLRRIDGHNNQLKSLNLFNFPELKEVNIPFNNQMTDLKISQCPNIHTIFCFNNNLSYLPNLQQFKNLKKLHCYKNPNLGSVICRGLKHLEELNAQECNVGIVNFEGCESLRILDLAENQIRKINIQDCVNLEQFSARDNFLKDIDLSNNHKLASLFIPNNCFPPIDISKFSHLVQLKSLMMGLQFPTDQASEEKKNPQRFIEYYQYNRWFGSLEAFKDMKYLVGLSIRATDIDRGQKFLSEKLSYFRCQPLDEKFNFWQRMFSGIVKQEPRKCKVIHDWWEVEKIRRQTNPTSSENVADEVPEPETSISGWKKQGRKETQACDYEPPLNKDNIRYLDLSHWRLKGDLKFEDWPKLKELNVGNNKLTSLTVKNCPNLTVLRYAHNEMSKEATIKGCPNLKTIENYKYNEGDWDEHLSIEEIKTEEKRAEIDKSKQKLANRVYLLVQRADQGEQIPWQAFLDIFKKEHPQIIFDSLEPNLSQQFKEALVQRLEPKILELINKTNKENLTPEQLIVELEPYKDLLFLLSEDVKAQLRGLFQTTEQTLIKDNINYIPLYLIFVIAGLRVGFLLIPKKKNSLKISSWISISRT